MTKIQRVLVADDDPDVRTLVVMNLELSGYEVATAGNGAEVAAMALELMPDIIVLDVMMPRMDGFKVLEGLKADPATKDIPVVMLTAKSSDQDVWNGWQSGAAYYMTKPFEPEHLLRYIGHLRDPDGCPIPGYDTHPSGPPTQCYRRAAAAGPAPNADGAVTLLPAGSSS